MTRKPPVAAASSDAPPQGGAGTSLGAAKICVAKIGAPHGVRGEVKLWSYTDDPFAVGDYGALETGDGRQRFEIESLRAAKDHLVARLAGIDSREAAERLNGIEIYVTRDRLPPPSDDEFYHADLIGLQAVTLHDHALGRIVAVHNFGAGDIIEIAPEAGGPTLLLPFSNAVVPTVDLAAGRVIVVPPEEIDGEDPTAADI